MVEADIERVQAIERQSFATPWSANTYRSELRNQSTSRYVVARASPTPPPPQRDDTTRKRGILADIVSALFGEPPEPTTSSPHPIVGYGGLWLAIDEGHVTTIAVEPAYRGHGIGELVLNGLIDQAMQLNAEMLTLEVRVSNVVAQQLYLKYGFRAIGTRPRYYTDNNEDALIMSTDPIRTPAYQERLKQLRTALFERLRQEAANAPPVVKQPIPQAPAPAAAPVAPAAAPQPKPQPPAPQSAAPAPAPSTPPAPAQPAPSLPQPPAPAPSTPPAPQPQPEQK
ncbi:ribosomal-protein-alanine N-acetyltransferase [Chloroflexia bacterium SDU3-3]|nr:ribosomal-protein-alanine N-acetyltransferase [Chloroflexia bacterium SDU3-3]